MVFVLVVVVAEVVVPRVVVLKGVVLEPILTYVRTYIASNTYAHHMYNVQA